MNMYIYIYIYVYMYICPTLEIKIYTTGPLLKVILMT